jgi:hypothetical protein
LVPTIRNGGPRQWCVSLSRLGFESRVEGMRLLSSFLLVGLLASPVAAQRQRLWGSVGLGPSDKGVGVMASASYSLGPALVVGRLDAAANFSGPAVDDRALLVGGRSSGSHGFVLAAIGISRARYTYLSSDVAPRREPPQTGVAFEVKGQGGSTFAQAGISMLGVIGPERARYVGFVLSLNVGWFGKDDG